MVDYSTNTFGAAIDTNEISNGAVTPAKLSADALGLGAPIGSILAWHKSFTNTPALPAEWLECNGQTVSDVTSVYNGQALPDLNSVTASFLRGSNTSGSTGGADTHTHTGTTAVATSDTSGQAVHTSGSLTHSHTFTTNSGSTLPVYMSVVWIMRIK